MILSYQNILSKGTRRRRIKAEITTKHSASSYGQPVIVLEDGGALDLTSWVAMDYKVARASMRERDALIKMGLL